MREWRMPWPRCTWPPRRGTSTCSSTWWRSPGATYTLEPRMGWRRSMQRRRWAACPASSGWSSNRWNNWFWWHWLRGWQLILIWFFPRGVTIFLTWPDFFRRGLTIDFLKGVDVNIRDGDEATPLHFAASRGHTETVICWYINWLFNGLIIHY